MLTVWGLTQNNGRLFGDVASVNLGLSKKITGASMAYAFQGSLNSWSMLYQSKRRAFHEYLPCVAFDGRAGEFNVRSVDIAMSEIGNDISLSLIL